MSNSDELNRVRYNLYLTGRAAMTVRPGPDGPVFRAEIPGEDEWTPLGYITKDSDGPILDGTPLPEVGSSGPRFLEGENPDA